MEGAICAAAVLLVGVVGWTHRWVTDDGFIYLRSVRELLHGHGPVFNTGQRVEAFTSPLWLGLLALVDVVTPFRLEWISALSGIVLTMCGAALAVAGSARIAHRTIDGGFTLPLGILVFVAVPATWYWESGGLETGLVIAWVGLSYWLLARWATSDDARLSSIAAAVLGIGWLVRPELLVVSALLLLAVLLTQWRSDRWVDRVRLVVSAAALPIAYEIFRMGYYGMLVANTAVAKEGTKTRFAQGWLYLEDFARPYLLWLPVVLLLAGVYGPLVAMLLRGAQRRAAIVVATFASSGVVYAGSVVAYGGDYLHGRLLLPAWFLLCAPVAVIPASKRYVVGGAVLLWALVCGFALRPPELRHPSGLGPHQFALHYRRFVTIDDSGWNAASEAKWFRGPGIYVQGHVFTTRLRFVDEPAAENVRLPAAVLQGIGAPSYALGQMNVLDVHGLADPLAAHLRLVRRGYPGHEKTLGAAWIAAMLTSPSARPSASAFPIEDSASTPYDQAVPFAQEVEFARRALECPAIRDLRESTTRPLTVGSFFSNIVHSFRRTTIRIPSDPKVAYQRFCSPAPGARARAAGARHGKAATPPPSGGIAVGRAGASGWSHGLWCGSPGIPSRGAVSGCGTHSRGPPGGLAR